MQTFRQMLDESDKTYAPHTFNYTDDKTWGLHTKIGSSQAKQFNKSSDRFYTVSNKLGEGDFPIAGIVDRMKFRSGIEKGWEWAQQYHSNPQTAHFKDVNDKVSNVLDGNDEDHGKGHSNEYRYGFAVGVNHQHYRQPHPVTGQPSNRNHPGIAPNGRILDLREGPFPAHRWEVERLYDRDPTAKDKAFVPATAKNDKSISHKDLGPDSDFWTKLGKK